MDRKMIRKTYKKSIFNYRFPVTVVIATLIFFIMLSACKKENEDESGNGILNVKLRTWNTYIEKTDKSSLRSSYVFDLVDVRTYKYEMKFTTDYIQEGMLDSDINWITVYTSNEMMLDSERDFQFELPAGTYKGFALLQGSDFFWVISDGNKIIEIPDSNSKSDKNGNNSQVYNVFGLDGLYITDANGKLQKVLNDEKIGTSFTISPDTEHSLIVRMNFDKMVWNDNDESGDWSNGDAFEGPTLPEGIETMSDFIFE
ncbi:MAG: hypothetical protein C0595_07440 [Marinilabiliales bacterium]|nr:MAG: hypothetical protein C0595_07440 [Marinilabiliales bacterium]